MGLEDNGYLAIRHLLHDSLTEVFFQYVLLRHETGTMSAPDDTIPTAPRLYGDAFSESLLSLNQRRFEHLVGAALWPSYSYVRLHGSGDSMPMHVDRDASEVGVSICVGGDASWPLWFRTPGGDSAVSLEPGDGVIYYGQSVPHWREPFRGSLQVQCMLFYVRQDGPFGEHRFDGRPRVGIQKPE